MADVVLCVDAHPTQHMLASGGLAKDKTVRIWVDESQPPAQAPAHKAAAAAKAAAK